MKPEVREAAVHVFGEAHVQKSERLFAKSEQIKQLLTDEHPHDVAVVVGGVLGQLKTDIPGLVTMLEKIVDLSFDLFSTVQQAKAEAAEAEAKVPHPDKPDVVGEAAKMAGVSREEMAAANAKADEDDAELRKTLSAVLGVSPESIVFLN